MATVAPVRLRWTATPTATDRTVASSTAWTVALTCCHESVVNWTRRVERKSINAFMAS